MVINKEGTDRLHRQSVESIESQSGCKKSKQGVKSVCKEVRLRIGLAPG